MIVSCAADRNMAFKMDARVLLFTLVISLCSQYRVTADDTGTAISCGPGWVTYNSYCYLFNNIKKVMYSSAQTECNGMDSSLLRVLSADELTWYTKAAKNFSSAGYWTDLNDIPKSVTTNLGTSVWKWGSYTLADMTYMHWARAPANDGVSNCAGVNMQGALSDLDCTARQGWMCQYVASDTNCVRPGCTKSNRMCYCVADTNNATQLLSWADADQNCRTINPTAYLITIDNADDQTFISNQMKLFSQSTAVMWTGLVYRNNSWTWSNGDGFNTNFFTWQTEPDNVAGTENCGVLRTNGLMSDRDCTTFNNFICKKPKLYYYASDNIGCGPWVRAGQFCYQFYYTQTLAWSDARKACQKHNGDLVKVDSLDKRFWLVQQLLDPAYSHTFWTGCNDRATEGTYVWADGTPINTDYINWNREPNDYMGNEDCGLLYNTGQYNDAACGGHAAAICEIDAQSRCPRGWRNRPSDSGTTLFDCYLFTPYNNATLLYTQMEASAYCSSIAITATLSAQLLSVNSKAEQTFIRTTVKSMMDNNYGWWTSLNDIQAEGYWNFAQGFTGTTFVDWQGEPSTDLPSWDCAFVNNAGAYHERDCTSKQGYICERRATNVPGSNGAGSLRGINGVVTVITLCGIIYNFALKLV